MKGVFIKFKQSIMCSPQNHCFKIVPNFNDSEKTKVQRLSYGTTFRILILFCYFLWYIYCLSTKYGLLYDCLI